MANASADDPDIPDDERLLRRIPPRHFVFDKKRGRWRPSSAAFEDDPDGGPMSVYLEGRLIDAHLALVGHASYALSAITAGLARELNQVVEPAPLADPHPAAHAHAHVVGTKTKSISRRFALCAGWVVPPPTSEGADQP